MVAAEKQGVKVHDMVYIGMFAVLIAICSWISIPMTVPFTLQTLGVFLAVGVLGGKRGTMAVLIYLLLGAAGIPVFAEFTSGIYIILGNTGGYLVGFLFAALIVWGMEKLPGKRTFILGLSMVLGMIVYDIFGTVWFMAVYAGNSGEAGLLTVLGWCVFPFIIPDLLKIALALSLRKRLRSIIKID